MQISRLYVIKKGKVFRYRWYRGRGPTSMEFRSELSESQFDELKFLVRESYRILHKSRVLDSDSLDLKTIGEALYKLIFSEDLQSLIRKNTAPLFICGGDPLFPWEILHDGKGFISHRIPIGRLPIWLDSENQLREQSFSNTGEFERVKARDDARFIFCADPLSDNRQSLLQTEFIYNSIPKGFQTSFLTGAEISKSKLQQFLDEYLVNGVQFFHLSLPVLLSPAKTGFALSDETLHPLNFKVDQNDRSWLFLHLYPVEQGEVEDPFKLAQVAISLGEGFIERGFTGAVISLSPDFSDEMSRLIVDYYQSILAGKPPAQALTEVKKQYFLREPFSTVWSKLIFIGDPSLPALSRDRVFNHHPKFETSIGIQQNVNQLTTGISNSPPDGQSSLEGNFSEGSLEYDFDLEQAIGIALMEAKNLRQDFIGTPHLFIGLTKCPGGVTRALLESAGFEPKKVRDTIRYALGYGHAPIDAKILPTQRCARALKNAELNARREGDNLVREKHLLAAILQSGEGLAFEILKKMGADPHQLYQRLMREDFDLKKQQSEALPTIERYGRDLTKLARENKLPPLLGRSEELMRLTQILLRRFKNNPLIIGEAGVGKTALVEGLAQRIVAGAVPKELQERRIIELSLSSLVAGTRYRGDFEERLTQVIREAKENPNVILFLDEFHTIVGAGETHQGTLDAANILKPALARGEIRCIGATTPTEYRKYIERDAALERRFHPLFLNEPTPDESFDILEGSRPVYEEHHRVKIPRETLKTAIELSVRYLPQRRLPDKALDLIDEACALINLRGPFSSLITPDGKIRSFGNIPTVTVEALHRVISDWTGIPVGQISREENQRLLELESKLSQRVVGQPEAVTAVSEAVQLGRTGLRSPNRPIAVFLFIGPSGVGKTELSKALAMELFGDEKALIRVDMSEFSEKHSSSKMLGAPPGYVGYGEESPLLSKLYQKPYSVVLFDEIEKAHPSILDLFLQLFEEGRITDSVGRTIDGRHAVFIMTSNLLGEKFWRQTKKLGFQVEDNKSPFKEQVRSELLSFFRPEFLNRIDEIVLFNPLSEESLLQIAKQRLQQLAETALQKGILLSTEESAIRYLVKESLDPALGARPLLRNIEDKISRPLSRIILSKRPELSSNQELHVKFTLLEGHPTLQIVQEDALSALEKSLDKTPVDR